MAKHMLPDIVRQTLQVFTSRSDLMPFEIILRTGCRTHELRSMVFSGTMAHITAAKGSNDHVIPLPDAFLARIGMHWSQHLNQTSNLCHEAYKRFLRAQWALLRIQHPFLQPYSLHSLRSGFAILHKTQGTDLMTIKYMLGHRSLASTAHYLATCLLYTSPSPRDRG